MAVKTHWSIDHACGHTAQRDLSDRRADERARFARWLATKDCADCWRGQRADAEDRAKEELLAAKRAEETSAIETWERQAQMPALTGSDKSIAWGQTCRHIVMSGAYSHHVLAGEMTEEDWAVRFEAAARTVTAASWWIDNRDSGPADVAELLAAANSGPAADVLENPY
jgi:hypothetical protein